MKKYWAGALAAACCAVGSGAALASVFVTVSQNEVVAAAWGQPHQPIEPFGHDQPGHDTSAPGDVSGPIFTKTGELGGPTAAKLVRLDTDRRASAPDGTAAIRLPEPATWAMMFVGLSMIGLATRRRRNVDVPYD